LQEKAARSKGVQGIKGRGKAGPCRKQTLLPPKGEQGGEDGGSRSESMEGLLRRLGPA